MTQPTGSTQVAAVIGSPVGHSLSPAIHNAAFAAVGIDWTFVALDVAAGSGAAAVDAMRVLGLAGLSVTMPHKADVLAGVDRCTAAATELGAVNCIYRDGNILVGDNTDGAGFVDAVEGDHGISLRDRRCVVVGAGGAARAVVAALGRAGAAEVVVVARRAASAEAAAVLAGRVGRTGGPSAVDAAEVVVNATPLGMAGPGTADQTPFAVDGLRPGQIVVDLVYHPVETPLLRAARAGGAVPVDGLGMLVHQAARAFTRWTSLEPPLPAMRAALTRSLSSSPD